MQNRLNKFVIVFPFDPSVVEEKASGNPATYLKFIKYLLKEGKEVYLIGLKESDTIFEHENFSFIPLFDQPKHWALFAIKLMIKAPFLGIPVDGVIISSHMAYLLPFTILNFNLVVFESVFENFKAFKNTSNYLFYKIGKSMYNIFEPKFLKKINLIIVSPRYKEYYEKKYPDLKGKIFEMTHESINTDLFVPMNSDQLKPKYGLSKYKKVIVQVAVINRKKRIELSIKSLSIIKQSIPDIKLLIVGPVGDEKYKLFLDKLIKELDITENIEFIGEVPLKLIPEFINCADVLIISSTAETGPIPPIEAFACGIPVVSTDVGLIPLLIRNNKLGRILPVNTGEKEFAENIIEILDQKENNELKMKRRQIAREFDVKENQINRLNACNLALKKDMIQREDKR